MIKSICNSRISGLSLANVTYSLLKNARSLPRTQYLANIFQGRIEYELIYSLRGAKHRVDYYSVHIR